MDNYRDETRLLIMLKHCKGINNGLKVIKTYNDFVNDKNEIYRNAILYSILQIGENVYNLSIKFKEENNKIPWGKIVKTRHIVVHHYYEINDELIWDICKNDIKELEKFLKDKLLEYKIDTNKSTLQLKKPL